MNEISRVYTRLIFVWGNARRIGTAGQILDEWERK